MTKLEKQTFMVRDCAVSLMRGGAGKPLLYLHGAGGAPAELPFMTALAANHDLIVPEHPGFGASDEPDWFDNIHDVAYFYLDFLEALDLRDVHLVGSSLGGWIAAEIAVRSTERLASLTLLASAGLYVPGLKTGDIFTWSPDVTMKHMFHDPELAAKAIAALAPQVEADDAYLKNRASLARLAWEPRLHDPHLAKWLHRIDVPTLVLWGDDDQVFEAAHADAFTRLIPGARAEIVPACGHLIHIERPDVLVDALDRHIVEASK